MEIIEQSIALKAAYEEARGSLAAAIQKLQAAASALANEGADALTHPWGDSEDIALRIPEWPARPEIMKLVDRCRAAADALETFRSRLTEPQRKALSL